jgi:hypothetical protein
LGSDLLGSIPSINLKMVIFPNPKELELGLGLGLAFRLGLGLELM